MNIYKLPATAGGNPNTINLSPNVYTIIPIDSFSPSLSSVKTMFAFNHSLLVGLDLALALVFMGSQ
jgi:hypothetical protein